MKIFIFLSAFIFSACTSAVIHDNQNYDKNQLTSSTTGCWGYCSTLSADGETCIAYSSDISKNCKRYFDNAK